jgi:hypothetical protein
VNIGLFLAFDIELADRAALLAFAPLVWWQLAMR